MLVNVLREHWREGLGGIKLADMRESYPKTDSMLSVEKFTYKIAQFEFLFIGSQR